MLILYTLLTVSVLVIVQGKPKLTPVVQTDKGLVRGHILHTIEKKAAYSAFEGIPFAKPPIGRLRFKPPVEPQPWADVLDATLEGNLCLQPGSAMNPSRTGSEDCLYINVYAPHTKFDQPISKAVLLFIHGGGFTNGNSQSSFYGPDFLIQEDIIVVTFNYRLGAFGFLNLNHENAAGNCGLKDQNWAMKWVAKNIAAFGGDPSKVTVLGQSAGSVFVDLHVISDASAGLFRQSICMSGTALNVYWGFQSNEVANKQAFKLGSLLGVKTQDKDVLLEALLNAPALDIVQATDDLLKMPFKPTVESTSIARDEVKIVTKCAVEKYFTGNYTKGSHLLGFTSHESILFGKPVQKLINMTTAGLESIKKATIHIPILSQAVTSTANDASHLLDVSLQKIVKESSSLLFFSGIDARQRLLSLHNDHPVYYYRFSFNSEHSLHKSLNINISGVAHADDMPYLFHMPMFKIPIDQPDIALTRKRMVRMFANFVKFGNPTPDGPNDELLNVTWPDSRFTGNHLEINGDLSVGPRPMDNSVTGMQKVGLRSSPIFNECPKNVLLDVNKLYRKRGS